MPSSNVTINDTQEVPTWYLADSGPGPWPCAPKVASQAEDRLPGWPCSACWEPARLLRSRVASAGLRGPSGHGHALLPSGRAGAPLRPLLPAFLSPSPERPSSGPRQSPGPRVLSSRLRRDLSHYRAGGWARTLEALQLPGHPLWLSRLPTSDSASPCLVPLPPRRGLLAVGKVTQVEGRRRGCA